MLPATRIDGWHVPCSYAKTFRNGRLVVVPDCGTAMHRDALDAVVEEIRRIVQIVTSDE